MGGASGGACIRHQDANDRFHQILMASLVPDSMCVDGVGAKRCYARSANFAAQAAGTRVAGSGPWPSLSDRCLIRFSAVHRGRFGLFLFADARRGSLRGAGRGLRSVGIGTVLRLYMHDSRRVPPPPVDPRPRYPHVCDNIFFANEQRSTPVRYSTESRTGPAGWIPQDMCPFTAFIPDPHTGAVRFSYMHMCSGCPGVEAAHDAPRPQTPARCGKRCRWG